MNDPNGLVHYDGEYHLFYQYAPDTIEQTGPKHWGHAVSQDLVHWRHLPVALYPDSSGAVWSGSAVVDWQNSGGFQSGDEKALAAFYTAFDRGHQEQALAVSTDRGRSWTRYARNPVIPNPGLRDFRDPKVFWHAESFRWVMVLVAGDRVRIYTSTDLISWAPASEFGAFEGSHSGVWECPDLFPLAVDGNPDQTRWVLLVSVGTGSSPSGGSSGVQYFIGDFDGTTFTNCCAPDETKWIDYGRDNYAAVTFADIPPQDGRRILIGWMSNWTYAGLVPTSPWRGAMTIPRELQLITGSNGPELISLPVQELSRLRRMHIPVSGRLVTSDTVSLAKEALAGDAFEVKLVLEVDTVEECGIEFKNHLGDKTLVGYHVPSGRIFVDRRNSGVTDFQNSFVGSIDSAALRPTLNRVELHIFFDRSSVEVFADNGRVVITDCIFPQSASNHLAVYARNGTAKLVKADVWKLDSIWD